MSEIRIANVTYVDGDTRLGFDRIKVTLIAGSTGLVIRKRSDERNLMTIPWPNIREYKWGARSKSTAGMIGAYLIAMIGLGTVSRKADTKESGITVQYWEEEAQANQSPFFAVGSVKPDKCHKIGMQIIQYRDDFVRKMTKGGRPK